MPLVLIGCAVVLVLGAAAVLVVSSYGRFASKWRVKRSTVLPLADADTSLDRLFAVLAPKTGGASGLALLENNDDAFVARAIAARSAGRSLDMMYCIWHRDLTGRLLAHEIIEAADRGVRVRMLF